MRVSVTKSVEVMENVQNGYFFDKMAFFLRPSRADWLLIRRSLVRAQVEEPRFKQKAQPFRLGFLLSGQP